jgi:hypothetical protein
MTGVGNMTRPGHLGSLKMTSDNRYHMTRDSRRNEKLQFLFWLQTYTGEEYNTSDAEFLVYWSVYQKGKAEGRKQEWKNRIQ